MKSDTKISSIVVKKAIVADLESTKRDAAITELVKKLIAAKKIKESEYLGIIRAVLSRERRGTTGLGKGIAIPHARMPECKTAIGALGRSKEGIDFSALDGALVHTVFLFVLPADPPEIAFGLMSRMAELCRHPNYGPFIRSAKNINAIHEVLVDGDSWE